ncbi:hypothetical protein ACA910_002061 [Epithemia clementina (nom. ined.)]
MKSASAVAFGLALIATADAAGHICSADSAWAEGLKQVFYQGAWPTGPIGSTTQIIADAADAGYSGAPIVDGMSGDTNFPHGDLKVLTTVGEYSICEDSAGEMIVGVPDGLGAYLYDDDTVRVIVQSESYGPLKYESYPYFVNDGAASFTGSHLQYVDYERYELAMFMESDYPASTFVKGMGEMIKYSYNLKGELVGPRIKDGPTTVGAHYSNTDAEGNYIVDRGLPGRADWLMQSFCSAHLEQKHQWGDGIGFEDNVYINNEEWMDYMGNITNLVGIAPHVIDIANHADYALGVLSQSGFEKIVEINPMHPGYIVLAISGYNGEFNNVDIETIIANRNALFQRNPSDPTESYSWPKYTHPARIYVGKKGYDEKGIPATDFLSRNGLRFGQLYGFAIDMTAEGPTGGLWRDPAHQVVGNGFKVPGMFAPINWSWTGEVVDYIFDAAWEFQAPPLNVPDGYQFWNGQGNDAEGCKTEHLTPDPRLGMSGYVQGSTCGYFGHYYLEQLGETLNAASGGFPDTIQSTYYVYEGERDIFDQIVTGGKGQYANGQDVRWNCDSSSLNTTTMLCSKTTFEDVDGLELLEGKDGKIYAIIQEDSSSILGDRMFITSPLEHLDDGKDLTYYFIAMSGGAMNSRGTVGIPAGTAGEPEPHEFSGIFDLSGLLAMTTTEVSMDDMMNKTSGGQRRRIRELAGKYYLVDFIMSADDTGYAKRAADRTVDLNDKTIILNLQAHDLNQGVINDLQLDRGGQWYTYRPNVPYH